MIIGVIDGGLLLVIWDPVESVEVEAVVGGEPILGGGTEIGGILP